MGLGKLRPRPVPPPHCTNVTAHPSTASVPITVLLYDGPLLCSFNVAIKDLSKKLIDHLFLSHSDATRRYYRRVSRKLNHLELYYCYMIKHEPWLTHYGE